MALTSRTENYFDSFYSKYNVVSNPTTSGGVWYGWYGIDWGYWGTGGTGWRNWWYWLEELVVLVGELVVLVGGTGGTGWRNWWYWLELVDN